MPNCQTGRRFLIVKHDGRLTTCAMYIDDRYDSLDELRARFTDDNVCGGCYISIRADTEKSAWELISDNLRALKL